MIMHICIQNFIVGYLPTMELEIYALTLAAKNLKLTVVIPVCVKRGYQSNYDFKQAFSIKKTTGLEVRILY